MRSFSGDEIRAAAPQCNERVIRAAMDLTLETTAVLTSNAPGIPANSEDADEARAALRECRAPLVKGR